MLKSRAPNSRPWRKCMPGEGRLVGTGTPGGEGQTPEIVSVAGVGARGVDHAARGAAAFGELQAGAERGIGRDFDSFGFEEAEEIHGHGFRDFHVEAVDPGCVLGEVNAGEFAGKFLCEFFGEAEADAGHVDGAADGVRGFDDVAQDGALFLERHGGEANDGAGVKLFVQVFENRCDGEIAGAADIDADEAVTESGFQSREGGGAGRAVACFAAVGEFGGKDNFGSQERRAAADEGEFVVLIIGDFVFGAGAGFGGCDFLTRIGIVDFDAHFPGVGAGEAREFDAAAGGHAVKHVLTAVAGAGDAAQKIFVAAENRLGGFPDGGVVLVKGEFVEDEVAAETAGGAGIRGEDFDAAFAAGDFDADLGGEEVEFDGARFGFEDSAVFGADSLAFLGKFGAVLLAVRKNCDQAAGASEESVNGPGGEDGRFAKLAGPVQAEDASGVVVENGDLIRSKFHGP